MSDTLLAPPRRDIPAGPGPAAGSASTGSVSRLRRNLLLVAAAVIVLPMLIAYAALNGMARADQADARIITLLTAQRYQQDADMMHDALHSDVLAAMLPPDQAQQGADSVQARAARHAGTLREDLTQLAKTTLTDRARVIVRELDPALRSYADRAEALVDQIGRAHV